MVEPIPNDIQFKLGVLATEFNKKLNDENWSVEFFKEPLEPELVKNQCAMEKFILILHWLNLKILDGVGNLDFEYSLKFFKKSLNLLKELFPKSGNMAVINLKNMFNASAPGFFKNLIFKGGPNLNSGIISIKDKDSLNLHIDSFNTHLSELGIYVEHSNIIQECNAILQKLDGKEKIEYNWLIEWMNTKYIKSYILVLIILGYLFNNIESIGQLKFFLM